MRHRFRDGLHVFRTGMQEEVDVRVNQPGKKSAVSEIDDFCRRRARDFRADFFYDVGLDQDFAGGEEAARFYVQQARGVEDNRMRLRRGWRLRLDCLRAKRRAAEGYERESKNGARRELVRIHVVAAMINQFCLAI